jgi:hypothetical protein
VSSERAAPGPGVVIDVERLVADIRRRAVAYRERGAYPDSILGAPFDLDLGEGGAGSLAAPIRLRPQLGYSSKPVIGRIITLIKRVVEKLVHHVVQDGLDQASLKIEHLARSLEDVERRAEERAEAALRGARSMVEAARRERREEAADAAELMRAVGELQERVDALSARIDGLERPAAPPRA